MAKSRRKPARRWRTPSSNTEPFLRLVLEAKSAGELSRRKAELVALLGEPAE
jgi:hypothetical protein